MKDRIKSLEELIKESANPKLVLIGFLDLFHQMVDRQDELQKKVDAMSASMEAVMKAGGEKGGFSIG